MRLLTVFTLLALLAAPAAAQLLDGTPPPKVEPDAPANISGTRQGGDTIADAFVIPDWPFTDTGTTLGYTDDYDEVCPYTGSTSPDVVYSYTPEYDQSLRVDLCGSSYDTKLYVYDENLALIACNDDFYFDDVCGVYVSALEFVDFMGGMTHYIVVDGYGGDAGEYELSLITTWECWLECPPDFALEGEPALQNDQDDLYNCGCGCEDAVIRIQALPGDAGGEHHLCGRSGWYTYQNLEFRDTDWFSVIAGPDGEIHATLEAEWATFLFHLAPADCDDVAVADDVESYCVPVEMTIAAEPESVVWLWVGPTTFAPPYGTTPYEFDYLLDLEGLAAVVATESVTWGSVKSLYR